MLYPTDNVITLIADKCDNSMYVCGCCSGVKKGNTFCQGLHHKGPVRAQSRIASHA